MSDETPRLRLAQLVSLQELNTVTWNEVLAQMDVLVDLFLLGQFVNTPPASPADGDAYLLGAAPTGAWSGYAYKIASCLDGAWRFYTPFNGLRAFVATTGARIFFVGGTWLDTAAIAETLSNKTFAGLTRFPGNSVIDASGNMGVGTQSPTTKLDVGGNLVPPAALAGANVRISDDTNGIAGVAMGNISTGTSADFRFIVVDTTNHYLAFAVPGVGNTGSLFGQTRSASDFIFNAGGTARNLTIGTNGATDVIVGTNGAEKMRITRDGQVGIRTATPTSPLHVVGLPVHANNAAAVAAGLTAGAFYRTGIDPDPVCVVH